MKRRIGDHHIINGIRIIGKCEVGSGKSEVGSRKWEVGSETASGS
ncbi:MAG: hypothetical protein R2828_16505 [Saprospiraceae bacterium]